MNPTLTTAGAALALMTLSGAPSPAAAQAGSRAGAGTAAVPYAVAVRFTTPPALDGRLDEWTQQPLVLDHRAHLLTDSADYAGDADLSARIWFAWDDSTLYVAGAVVDDDVTRGEAWDRDRVNLVFDWRNDTTPLTYGQQSPPASSWQPDDYWVYFQPFWEKGPGVIQRMDRHGQGPAAGARLASRRTADGYTFEAAIPASALPEYSPFVAAVAGLQVFVSDGDRGQPLTELMWSAAWAHDDGLAWELDRMGRLVFAGAEKR